MSVVFCASSKAEQVAAAFKEKCSGKTVIVTGANTGLGLETVRVLAEQGATVVLCSRSKEKGKAALLKLK